MNTLERLQGMVNKPYLYRNEEVVVLGYCEGTVMTAMRWKSI